jgi:hypothetical protein
MGEACNIPKRLSGGVRMPRITFDLPQAAYDIICREAKERETTKKAALIHLLEHRKHTENPQELCVPRERASSPSAQKENNNINTLTEAGGSDASRISSFSSLENNTENSKKAPPAFLPDDWEPPKEFQQPWCFKREYCYETALETFKSKFKADPQRCSDWDSKWRFFLLNGYLKGAKFSELEKEEDSYGLAIGRFNPNAL